MGWFRLGQGLSQLLGPGLDQGGVGPEGRGSSTAAAPRAFSVSVESASGHLGTVLVECEQ